MAQISEHLKVCEDSDWYLLRSLWRLEVELGRSPTREDFPRRDCPDLDEYYLAFGKLRFARTAAGLATDRNQGIEAQKANLILDLIELGERLGRTPSAIDLNEAARKNECRYAGAYLRAFGSLKAAQELAGFTPNEAKTKLSRGQLVDALIKFHSENERFPCAKELDTLAKSGKTPWRTAVCRAFGSYEAAKDIAIKIISFEDRLIFKPGEPIESKFKLESILKMAVEDSDSARSRLLRFFEPFVALMSRASGRDLNIRELLEEQLATGETNIQTFSHNFHMSVLGACGITPRETNQT